MVILIGFISNLFSPKPKKLQKMEVQGLDVDDYDPVENGNINNPGILC